MQDMVVQYELNNSVATITLNRPQARNTVTPQLCLELSDAVTKAAEDDCAKVVILRGAGDHFCAGADLKQAPGERKMPLDEMLMLGGRAAMQLHHMPKPTIAAIRGSVAGGGLALALACDLRVADDTAKASFAYTKIGLSGDFGCLYFMSRLIGYGAAMELALTCPKLGAHRLRDWGLIREVVETDKFVETYTNLARQLSQMSGTAFAHIKANLVNSQTLSSEEYLKAEVEGFIKCRESGDIQQMMASFKQSSN
jgi:2-(1,2-epoxy-1,2-dihydrophenyl)acetyl-CoA isomerase